MTISFGNNTTGLQNFINNNAPTLAGNKKSQNLPWLADENNSVFFPPLSIDPDRWNRLYPYRLLVVEIKNGYPSIVSGDVNDFNTETSVQTNDTGYVISEQVLTGSWICTLPITPQQLSIADEYAINTTATMRGVIEEHNGLKFKLINVKGTTGIWPRRPSIGADLNSPSSIQSIFAGTLQGVSNLTNSLSNIGAAITGKKANTPGKSIKPEDSDATEFSTGYYQALYMGQFFERYAEAKKNPANKHWRLVFDIPKQNQSFVVTPVRFQLSQSQEKPNEMIFDFQLKAWKRIDLGAGNAVNPVTPILPTMNANLFQRVVNTISATRKTLSSAMNLIKAVRGDWQNSLNVLRQTALVIKDVGGFALSVADLPSQLVADFKSNVIDEWKTIGNSFQKPNTSNNQSSSNTNLTSPSLDVNSSASAAKSGAIMASVAAKDKTYEGLSYDEVSNGALGVEAASAQQADPINNIFDNADENFESFDAVAVDKLPLSQKQQDAIEDELNSVRLLTVDDFRTFRTNIMNLMLDISNNFGAGNATYNNIYGRGTPKTRITPMSVEENEILLSLMETIQCYDLLIATKRWDDLNLQNPLAYIGGLANEAGINFNASSQSKYLAPVPFGLTIEQIAARYLGDPDRWLEIATLNNLRSPYIDETGSLYSLLSNAEGRQFNIDNSDELLYIGQSIVLQSNTVPQFARKITDVEKISDDNYLVTVDGLADLSTLTTTDNARITAYLPGTMNSQNQLYIPTDKNSMVDDRTWGISSLDNQNLVAISKIDFLLTDQNDLAINSLGDFRLASGLTNLIQAFKLKVITTKGTLLRHLDFGLGISYGMSVADVESGKLIKEFNKLIKDDLRFDSINRMTIELKGATLAIEVSLNIANSSGIVPISFEVPL
jgi:hypothetical protein